MPTLPSEHNLLFAVLALQNELAKPEDVLAAMQAWVAAKHRSLGDLLVERGALSPEHRRLLDALIEAQLTRHGTANQSLVTLDPSSRVRGVLAPNEIKSERGGPGNVGELENSLEQTVLLASDNTIGPDCLSDDANRLSVGPIGASLGRQQGRACQAMMEDAATSAAPAVATDARASAIPWPTLAQLERNHIQRTLEQTSYNQRAAADLLGLHRQQLLRKIKKYGLDTSSSRPGRPNKLPEP